MIKVDHIGERIGIARESDKKIILSDWTCIEIEAVKKRQL